MIDPEQDSGDLRAPRADEAGQSEDLPRTDGERDVPERVAAGETFDLEQHVTDRGLDLRKQRDRPAHHVAHEIRGRHLRGRRGDDVLAVADGRAIAQLSLVQAVADEQDGDGPSGRGRS